MSYFKMPCGIHKAKALLESKFGVVLNERDSSFHGGGYYISEDQHWKLIRNKNHQVWPNVEAKTILRAERITPALETHLFRLGCSKL
jgi:hypothetical protein